MKPFPAEPWRYACPDCGSVDLMTHVTPTVSHTSTSCQRCYWTGKRVELIDKREGRPVAEVGETPA